MNDDIKEKFYSLEELKRTIDSYDGYLDNEEVYYFIGVLRFAYDYITNLQEENNKLKNLKYKFFYCSEDEESFTLNDYLEIGNKVYDLQEANERLKERENFKFNLKKDETKAPATIIKSYKNDYEDYKSRCEKATEYIRAGKTFENKETAKIVQMLQNDLLNILNGGDEE